jgi:hypothetical protein
MSDEPIPYDTLRSEVLPRLTSVAEFAAVINSSAYTRALREDPQVVALLQGMYLYEFAHARGKPWKLTTYVRERIKERYPEWLEYDRLMLAYTCMSRLVRATAVSFWDRARFGEDINGRGINFHSRRLYMSLEATGGGELRMPAVSLGDRIEQANNVVSYLVRVPKKLFTPDRRLRAELRVGQGVQTDPDGLTAFPLKLDVRANEYSAWQSKGVIGYVRFSTAVKDDVRLLSFAPETLWQVLPFDELFRKDADKILGGPRLQWAALVAQCYGNRQRLLTMESTPPLDLDKLFPTIPLVVFKEKSL